MKIAVLADIHSNHIALEACLKEISQEKVDAVALLGDYVSDCPYPQKTMELVRQIQENWACWCICGNREEYLIQYRKEGATGWKDGSRYGSLLYTYENLTERDLDWFESLPVSAHIRPRAAAPFLLCHGAIHQTKPDMLYRKRPGEILAGIKEPLLLYGHTHIPYEYSDKGKLLVNVGSVGVSVDGQTRARYAILEYRDGRWHPEIRGAVYDTGRVLREFEESGLLERGGMWSRAICYTLLTGRNYSYKSVSLVGQWVRKEGGSVEDEELWKRAARQLGCFDWPCVVLPKEEKEFEIMIQQGRRAHHSSDKKK
ncbi:MAG TPA: metallophosphoesterase [Candidatus Gallacutalibacter pullistercoris]|nr:metallophosphoesterase [Candidatus Gallacutalibacter pullistercoris]